VVEVLTMGPAPGKLEEEQEILVVHWFHQELEELGC
jgi:hypothetical protein